MKLYTEEQLLNTIKSIRHYDDVYDEKVARERIEKHLKALQPIELPSDSLCINCDESESTHNICMDCIIKIGKENIQLPSDEEIREERLLQFPDSEYANRANDRLAFYCGARMVINKIQGGNNEQ